MENFDNFKFQLDNLNTDIEKASKQLDNLIIKNENLIDLLEDMKTLSTVFNNIQQKINKFKK